MLLFAFGLMDPDTVDKVTLVVVLFGIVLFIVRIFVPCYEARYLGDKTVYYAVTTLLQAPVDVNSYRVETWYDHKWHDFIDWFTKVEG